MAERPAVPPDAPHHRIPLAHGLVGMVLFVGGGLLLVRAADALARGAWATPAILGAVHAFTLGWLLTLVVGTLYQLGPVALQVTPRAPGIWPWLLPLHTVGVVIVTWGVSVGRHDVAAFGWLLLVISTSASAIVLLGPWRAPEKTRARMRLVTLGFLALGVTLLLAASRLLWGWQGFIPVISSLRLAHIAFGLVGFGTVIAWALGSHVLPMFLGTRAHTSTATRWIPGLLLGGATLLLPTLFSGLAALQAVAVMVMAAGQGLIVWQGLQWFRNRANRALDPALTAVAIAFVALLLATVLQVVLAVGALSGVLWLAHGVWSRSVTIWGVLFLAGWLAMLIAGVLLRVFVFLSWMVRAGPGARPAAHGPVRVSQFSRPSLAWLCVALFAVSLLLLCVTIAAGSASGAQFAAGLYSTAAIVLLLHHALALFAPPRDTVAALPLSSPPLAPSPH